MTVDMPNDLVTLAGSRPAPGLADATGHGSAVSVAERPITRSAPSLVSPGAADDAVVLRSADAGRDFGGVFGDPVIVMAEGTVLATGTTAALRARTEVVDTSANPVSDVR